MFFKDFEFEQLYGKHNIRSIVDKYMIIYRGDCALFHKQGAEKNSWNKKGYNTTYDSCTCPGRTFRKFQECRHMKMLKQLGWKLKKKEPEKVKLQTSKKMSAEVEKQWQEAFKKYDIVDLKERKWMTNNAVELMQKYNVQNCGDAHKVWIESTNKDVR